MKDSGLSIHFQDDDERKRNKNQNPIEKEETNPEKKEEKKPEKTLKNIFYYRMQIIYIIIITCEVIAILLLSPIVLMGR